MIYYKNIGEYWATIPAMEKQGKMRGNRRRRTKAMTILWVISASRALPTFVRHLVSLDFDEGSSRAASASRSLGVVARRGSCSDSDMLPQSVGLGENGQFGSNLSERGLPIQPQLWLAINLLPLTVLDRSQAQTSLLYCLWPLVLIKSLDWSQIYETFHHYYQLPFILYHCCSEDVAAPRHVHK